MIRYPHLLAALYGQPWALLPSRLRAIEVVLLSRLAGSEASLPMPKAAVGEVEKPKKPYQVHAGTAIIPIQGIIGKHLGLMEQLCGGYDLDNFSNAMATAEADPEVADVLLAIDSPGGSVTGVPEAAERVRTFSKPVVSFTDSMAASAAYWIGSQASGGFVATPSAEVGSIGVYTAVIDESAAWAQAGLKLELMKAGKHKATGIAGIPLAAEDREILQASVDHCYSMFRDAVVDARKSVAPSALEGQMFTGSKAMDVGLVDSLVLDLGHLMSNPP